MNALRLVLASSLCALNAQAGDAFLDRVEQALTVSAVEGQVRARLSGTLELEGYTVQLPAPGVIRATDERLFSPRLSVFVDAQFGSQVYAFVQARGDRGFDPGERNGEVRLDEYALRFTPWRDIRFSAQVGKFATIVGNWANRHGGWTNPFITAPLPYEHLTGMWDTEAVKTSGVLLQWSHVRPGLSAGATANEKSLRIPIVWGPSYASGVAISGDVGRFRYATELKLGSLSSRPEAWLHSREQRHHPTVSARMGYRLGPMWNIGFSASSGSYLRESAAHSLAPGHGRGAYRQAVLAQDVAFAWHHLQLWAELYAAKFEIPAVGAAETLAYYAEAKYKFTPQLFAAVRWNEQLFARIPEGAARVKWGQDVWRIDVAPGYRFTPHTQLKFQYSLQRGDSGRRDFTRTMAAQFTLRF
jgi:hypothetical protein